MLLWTGQRFLKVNTNTRNKCLNCVTVNGNLGLIQFPNQENQCHMICALIRMSHQISLCVLIDISSYLLIPCDYSGYGRSIHGCKIWGGVAYPFYFFLCLKRFHNGRQHASDLIICFPLHFIKNIFILERIEITLNEIFVQWNFFLIITKFLWLKKMLMQITFILYFLSFVWLSL